MSELLAIGVSHKTAPVEVRERLALPERRATEFLRDLRGGAEVHEAVAVSTCNRTELYLVVGDPVEAESTVSRCLPGRRGSAPPSWPGRSTRTATATRRATSTAWSRALSRCSSARPRSRARSSAPTTRRWPRRRPARSPTACSARRWPPASACAPRPPSARVSSASRRGRGARARAAGGARPAAQVVIIGTGETSELTARALADSGAGTVFVANRRRDRALSLARRYHGTSSASTSCPRRSSAPTSSSPPPPPAPAAGGRESRGDARPRRAAAAADRPGRPRDIDAACGGSTASRCSTSTTSRR